MAYTQPAARSCASLAGKPHSPARGSILDISSFVATAVPAGSRGRIIAVGDSLYEQSAPTKPVRFIGNNTGASLSIPLDTTLAPDIADKWIAKGVNFVRLHGPENYLMVDGVPYGATVARVGNCNFSPTRWDEFCKFIAALVSRGIYFSLNPASTNLALNMGNNSNRYDSTGNTSGTATATVVAGEITAIAVGTPGTGYTFPPSVIITPTAGQPGCGAKYRATIDASGNVTGYQKISGGAGYVSGQVTVSNYGGHGKCKGRIRFDDDIKAQWLALVTYILTTPSTVDGSLLINSPALAFVECYNESHMTAPVPGGILANVYRAQLTPIWQKWLSDRYAGDIAALNTRYGGTTYTSFNDAALAYNLPGFTPTTRAQRCLWSDSITWLLENDVQTYSWYIAQLRTLGYTGLVTTRDMGGDVYMAKTFAETGSDIQTFHAYPALQDTYAAGNAVTSGTQKHNAPSSYADNPMYNCMNTMLKDKPRFWTEFGYPMPADYRGEMGLLSAGVSSLWNFSGITYHSSPAASLKFGPTNPTTLKGLWPHNWENDPLTLSSVWLGSLLFHRRDVDALPVSLTLTMNNKALSLHVSPSETTDPAYPTSRLQFIPTDYGLMLPIARIEYNWDVTNSAGVATTWQGSGPTGIGRTFTNLLPDLGFDATHEAYQWSITQGNGDQTQASDRPYSAARYPKNRQVFTDRVAGLFGINTARTQAGVPSKPFRNQANSRVKQGVGFVTNAARTQKGLPGNAYSTNFMDKRFWQNLLINHIEDGVLLGVTSMSMDPISTAARLVIVAASNCYNKGAAWQSNASTVANVPVTTGGSYTVPPKVYFTGGGGNGAVGVCELTGTAITNVRIIDGGTGYTSAPTPVLIEGTGSGGVLGTPVLAADPESKEILLATPYTADGSEGWPIQMRRHVVDFTLTDVDLNAAWTLYELDYSGQRIGVLFGAVRRMKSGLKIRIDSSRTAQPSVFFELVKG